ncbi:hypothetical protein O4H49_20340 [Kiloniella laminariae]|uniref:Uncharacterized protein n=1 Tax=Kiloniella laminariae TaxID=454162 RepID=A0ABT4LPS7_9PROT|nr:hypothetical protein [Kiloniella laminariae]MCZ4283145.1 hypothetical protein [Kiloniella laminariae]
MSDQVRERLYILAEDIAPYITGAWIFNKIMTEKKPGYSHIVILSNKEDRNQNIELCSNVWGHKGRIVIKGILPNQYGSKARITVNPARSGKNIAGDINRRLLPDYKLEILDAHVIKEKKSREETEFNQKINLLKKVTSNLSQRNSREYSFNRGVLQMYPGSDTVYLNLNLSFDEAIKVLCLLNNK